MADLHNSSGATGSAIWTVAPSGWPGHFFYSPHCGHGQLRPCFIQCTNNVCFKMVWQSAASVGAWLIFTCCGCISGSLQHPSTVTGGSSATQTTDTCAKKNDIMTFSNFLLNKFINFLPLVGISHEKTVTLNDFYTSSQKALWFLKTTALKEIWTPVRSRTTLRSQYCEKTHAAHGQGLLEENQGSSLLVILAQALNVVMRKPSWTPRLGSVHMPGAPPACDSNHIEELRAETAAAFTELTEP